MSRLEQLGQRPLHAVPRLGDTTDTSGDESDAGEPRRRLRSKKTYKMKGAWGTSDVGQFFVTGPTDVATKPSHFYCRICRKDVSVLTHGHHEILRHFQGSKHFPRDQRLRLETPGWEVLDYEGNVMSPAEVECQREKIMRAPLVVRDRETSEDVIFSEDVIVDETGAVDPNLGVMAKVSPSLKCCVWVEAISSSTDFGRSSLCPPFVSTWMSRGHATRSWLVVIGCSVCSTWLVCIQFF